MTTRLSLCITFAAILLLANLAPAQSTEPSADLVPAEMASTYIEVGKDMAMRVKLVHDDVNELTLNAAVRKQADDAINQVSGEIDDLLAQMQAGKMPPNQRVQAVPAKLMQARKHLNEILGPEQALLLKQKIESLRGEARLQLGQLSLMIESLQLTGEKKDQTSKTLTQAINSTAALPDKPLQGDDAATQRRQMNQILAQVHDGLAAVLSDEQQKQLGLKFAQLAMNNPTTKP